MVITPERVREIFKGLENGDGATFFKQVADDIDWKVMGTHPLAGQYPSKKAFIEGTFAKLGQVLPQGAQLHVENLTVKDDQAVVELHSLATANNGMRFCNRYCWVVCFRDSVIIRARAYLDGCAVDSELPVFCGNGHITERVLGLAAIRRRWSARTLQRPARADDKLAG